MCPVAIPSFLLYRTKHNTCFRLRLQKLPQWPPVVCICLLLWHMSKSWPIDSQTYISFYMRNPRDCRSYHWLGEKSQTPWFYLYNIPSYLSAAAQSGLPILWPQQKSTFVSRGYSKEYLANSNKSSPGAHVCCYTWSFHSFEVSCISESQDYN